MNVECTGAIALALLPGTLCDSALWEPMLHAVPSLRDQITPLSYAGQRSAADAARALLRELPPRFAVLGFSLGGMVALEIAAQAPDRLCGLALVASNGRPDLESNELVRRAAINAARRMGLGNYVRETLWPSYVADHRRNDELLINTIVEMAERVGLEVFAEQAEIAIHRADSRPRLSAIAAPALIVSGSDDVLNPVDRQVELVQGIPGATWCACQDVGHFVPLEVPARLGAAVSAWMVEVAAFDHQRARNG